MAAPLELTGVRLSGVPPLDPALPDRPCQVTRVTVALGAIDPASFGPRRAEEVPGTILTREPPDIPFSALGGMGPAAGSPHTISKRPTREPTSDELLDRLLQTRARTERLSWRA